MFYKVKHLILDTGLIPSPPPWPISPSPAKFWSWNNGDYLLCPMPTVGPTKESCRLWLRQQCRLSINPDIDCSFLSDASATDFLEICRIVAEKLERYTAPKPIFLQ